jgi:hypothetical protein
MIYQKMTSPTPRAGVCPASNTSVPSGWAVRNPLCDRLIEGAPSRAQFLKERA